VKVSAIVLAGAPNSGKLSEISAEAHEALIPLEGRPLVDWVVEALAASSTVEEIIVVGPKDELSKRLGANWPHEGKLIQATDSLLGNMQLGGQAAEEEHLLVVTADIPLLRPQTVDKFMARSLETGASICYPIVSEEDTISMFPHGKRTFIKLKDGTFTGGNIIYMERENLAGTSQLFGQVIAARKKPWQLVKILGSSFIFSFLFRQLTISRIEARARELGISARGIIMEEAEIGFDVDKPQDLAAIESALEDFRQQ